MPSSISNSKAAPFNRAIAALLCLGLLWFAALEYTSKRWLLPSSKIYTRTQDEFTQTRQITGGVASGKGRTVLVVGNSLLLEGVDMERLNQGLGPEWKAQRLVIEQTGLLDWYFGLKRLLREGVRPDAIVVMLNTRQVLFRFVLGETFAHFLMDAPDLPEVSQRANLHPTDATGYLVGRYSEFYGSRGTLRKVLLGKLIPGMASLAALIVPAGSQPLDPHKVELDTGEKLSLLKRMSEEWKLPILLAIPPTGEKLNYNENCLAGARAAGVTVIMPVPNGELGQQYFRDGFHLNQAGVDAYTPRLAVALKDALAAH